tara:strand:+ start:22 stop:429 length:408 start_codon:yes stop_codon:yes gene_type:complete
MDISKNWVTIFFDSPTRHFIKSFTKKGFTHCIAVAPEENGWLYIDTHLTGVHLDYYDDKTIKTMFEVFTKWDAVALQLRSIKERPPDRLSVSILTCSTLIARLYGLHGGLVTPYRLYCALKKRNASVFDLTQQFD